MYRTTEILSAFELLCLLRMHRGRVSSHNEADVRMIQAALRIYLSSECGAQAVRSHNPDFCLTDYDIQTLPYRVLLGRLENIICSLDYHVQCHDYPVQCQGTSYVHQHPSHQHQHQHDRQHSHTSVSMFNFFDPAPSHSHHSHPNDAPHQPHYGHHHHGHS